MLPSRIPDRLYPIRREYYFCSEHCRERPSCREVGFRRRPGAAARNPGGELAGGIFDRQRLEQALLNLVNNTLEASPAGERVTISCRCGKGGIVEITDRGAGIFKERMADIFTPFVTTKTEGTGLGLPIVKKVIEAHAGATDLWNNPDKGVAESFCRCTFPATSPIN